MYQNILYPTDGSESSEAASEHARRLASAFDATVHVLYVVEAQNVGLGLGGAASADEGSGLSADPDTDEHRGMVGSGADTEEVRGAMIERGESIVERAAAAFEDAPTVTTVEVGTPHSEILRYAEENDVDLVVMGTHGRTGIERYLLGSVTEKVVRLADPPVVTVRADEDA